MDEHRRRLLSLPLALLAWPELAALAQSARASDASSGDFGLTIPTARPRLWLTPNRLATARAWYRKNEKPLRRDDVLGHAFRYVMKRDAGDARVAIDGAMRLVFDVSRTSSNEARWFGESAILIFDWTYDQFTPEQRRVFIERWNGYLETLRHKQWGGPGMPQSNYFWGYLRNEIEWAIATYHENPAAKTLLDHALSVRWKGAFLPFAATTARGGVPTEGSQYGPYLLQYATVPLSTVQFLGRPMLSESPFFRDAVYWLLYATPPAPTTPRTGGRARWEVFPMGDDQFFQNGGSAERIEYGTFVSAMATTWKDKAVGQYAQHWMRMTSAPRPEFVEAVEERALERPLTALPLDYYSPGSQHFYGRTSWQHDATVFHIQLGSVPGLTHEHADHGNWQIWRRGRWLSRETTGYALEWYQTAAHNCLLVNKRGLADGDRNGQAVVRRLESRGLFAYAAVDLTPAYRNDKTAARHRTDRDNPEAALVEREFLFIRPLETLLIFDRVESRGAGVTKTFLAHFEQAPALRAPNEVIATNGDQSLRLVTLAPANAVRRVVFEGNPIGQHRLEVETSGTERSYFLHTAQARGAGEADVVARSTETSAGFTVTLELPSRGYARVTFFKESTVPASLQYSTTSLPARTTPLLSRVQEIVATDEGPMWEVLPGRTDA